MASDNSSTSSVPSPLSPSSSLSELIVNVVFGLVTCVIGFTTVWQGRRAWIMWHENRLSSKKPILRLLGIQQMGTDTFAYNLAGRSVDLELADQAIAPDGASITDAGSHSSSMNAETEPTPSP